MSENKGVIITEVFHGWSQPSSLEWTVIRLDPPAQGETGWRNRFDEYGSVIGQESFVWIPKEGDGNERE